LSAVLVAFCYQLPWSALRAALTTTLVALSRALGLDARAVSADTMELAGTLFLQTVGCTLVDHFFACAPLAWDRSATAAANARRLALLFVALFAFNVARLQIGLVAFAHGVPWWLAHQVVAGVAQFLAVVGLLWGRP